MSMIGNFLAVSEAQLQSYLADPALLEERIDAWDEDEEELIDVDKSWQALHYLLAKDPWEGEGPAAWVVLGGRDIGDDLGYGPGKYLTPPEVKAAHEVLRSLDLEAVRRDFVPETFEALEIYPAGLWIEEKEEALEYVLSFLDLLTRFYAQAAGKDQAVIKFVN